MIWKRRASGAAGALIAIDVLEEDDDGVWCLAPALTPHVHDRDGWAMYVQVAPILFLVPRTEPWVAAFTSTHAKVDISAHNEVDVEGARFVFEDVELDVVWNWGEPARVVDRDELDALALPLHEHRRVVGAAERVKAMADEGAPPFGAATRSRLGALCAEMRLRSYDVPRDTWMGGVWPHLLPYVDAAFSRDEIEPWLERQRRGEGWLLAAGVPDEVCALVSVGSWAEVVAVTPSAPPGMVDALSNAGAALAHLPAPPLD